VGERNITAFLAHGDPIVTKSTSALRVFALCGCIALTCQAVAAPPEPVTVEKQHTISATVVAIDPATRTVELSKDNERTTIQVAPEVRNFDRIKVGDEVVATYYAGLAAAFKKKGESNTVGIVDATTGTARQPEGGQPGAAVANKIKTTVIIESVDPHAHSVTFMGPSGMSRTVDVVDPAAQQFISKLKQGDEVELTYVEALAVTLEPKAR
jgi:Cu/Ag efflux protein CusF